MKKTCVNCSFYHGTVEDPQSNFHFHDYCSLWRSVIPSNVIFIREGRTEGYNDIEIGVAACWGFQAKEKDLINNFPKNSKEVIQYEDFCCK